MSTANGVGLLHSAKSVLRYLENEHNWPMSRMQLWRLTRLRDDPLPARLQFDGRRSIVVARRSRLDAWVARHAVNRGLLLAHVEKRPRKGAAALA